MGIEHRTHRTLGSFCWVIRLAGCWVIETQQTPAASGKYREHVQVFTVVAECIIARESAGKFVLNFYIAIEISVSYSRLELPGEWWF